MNARLIPSTRAVKEIRRQPEGSSGKIESLPSQTFGYDPRRGSILCQSSKTADTTSSKIPALGIAFGAFHTADFLGFFRK